MDKVIAQAPAKINLVLEVLPLGKAEEKHRLDSIFCTTTLADTLIFDFNAGSEPFNAQVSIESTDFNSTFINPQDNSLIKTVEHFKREYGFGFLPSGTLQVQLVKSIPAQAGFGGGSTDAAAMLRMLCWLGQVEPLSERSLAVARRIGADVPFFLHAGKAGLCARMGGYGDELVEVVPKPQLYLTLVKPARGVSTKKAYAAFDRGKTKIRSSGAADTLARALREEKGLSELAALFTNDMEPAAIEILPAIATIKEELGSLSGVLCAILSGSGSALFAVCENAESSQACMEHFANKDLWAVATLT